MRSNENGYFVEHSSESGKRYKRGLSDRINSKRATASQTVQTKENRTSCGFKIFFMLFEVATVISLFLEENERGHGKEAYVSTNAKRTNKLQLADF